MLLIRVRCELLFVIVLFRLLSVLLIGDRLIIGRFSILIVE